MKNYYDLLSVAADAGGDEIKRAFRREIARYHPDKVAHLGPEFLQIAEGRAAELTEAYRILLDPLARAQYDVQLRGGTAAPAAEPRPEPPQPEPRVPRPAAVDEVDTPFPPSPQADFRQERATRDEFIRRAALVRLREALHDALGPPEPSPARGFDAGYRAKPRRNLFGKAPAPLRVLARIVSTVDTAAVEETWLLALRAGTGGDASAAVLLMGSGLAPASELAAVVGELRRKLRGNGAPVLVPVDVRDFSALVPTDAPAGVRAVLDALRRSG